MDLRISEFRSPLQSELDPLVLLDRKALLSVQNQVVDFSSPSSIMSLVVVPHNIKPTALEAQSRQSVTSRALVALASTSHEILTPHCFSSDTPIDQLPTAIMSASLGRSIVHHDIELKIAALKESGYDGIEIHWDCLSNEARRLAGVQAGAPLSDAAIFAGARSVREKCDAAGLKVLCLEPFLHYPGLLPVSRRAERLKEVPTWFRVTDILGTNIIQVASPMFGGLGVSACHDRIVEDLTMLADMALAWRPQPKYWAYEAMCFGATPTRSWEAAWKQVQAVDRPNFGMVFDTFQILGHCYADPTASDGKAVRADEALENTLRQIRRVFGGPRNAPNRSKVFFVQLGDADAPSPPLSEHSDIFDSRQHATLKMCWARNYRKFPGEGYMPALRLAHTFIVECGWRGWISAEYFNADTETPSSRFPRQAAKRCRRGHNAFVAAMMEGKEGDVNSSEQLA